MSLFVVLGKGVVSLLSRNLVESTTIWWVPATVIALTSMAVAALWGAILYLAVLSSVGLVNWGAALGVAVVGALACAFVLHLVGALLLDCVDTVFLCYVMDKDRATMTRADVHDIFAHIPGCKCSGPAGGGVYSDRRVAGLNDTGGAAFPSTYEQQHGVAGGYGGGSYGAAAGATAAPGSLVMQPGGNYAYAPKGGSSADGRSL